jgi:hypothetical protein
VLLNSTYPNLQYVSTSTNQTVQLDSGHSWSLTLENDQRCDRPLFEHRRVHRTPRIRCVANPRPRSRRGCRQRGYSIRG